MMTRGKAVDPGGNKQNIVCWFSPTTKTNAVAFDNMSSKNI